MVVAMASIIGGDFVSPYVPVTLGVVVALIACFFFFSGKRGENSLSSDEMMTAILTQAIPSVQAFLDKEREKDRSSAVKNLVDMSHQMDKWNFGALELVEREIGKPAKRFRERFQKRLLPAVRTGDNATVRRMLELLKAIYGGFMLGNYTTENLRRWSDALEDLPERELRMSLRKILWLTPAGRMTLILLGSAFAGAVVYTIALSGAQATPKEALTIAAPVFAGVFAGLAIFAYMRPGTPS